MKLARRDLSNIRGGHPNPLKFNTHKTGLFSSTLKALQHKISCLATYYIGMLWTDQMTPSGFPNPQSPTFSGHPNFGRNLLNDKPGIFLENLKKRLKINPIKGFVLDEIYRKIGRIFIIISSQLIKDIDHFVKKIALPKNTTNASTRILKTIRHLIQPVLIEYQKAYKPTIKLDPASIDLEREKVVVEQTFYDVTSKETHNPGSFLFQAAKKAKISLNLTKKSVRQAVKQSLSQELAHFHMKTPKSWEALKRYLDQALQKDSSEEFLKIKKQTLEIIIEASSKPSILKRIIWDQQVQLACDSLDPSKRKAFLLKKEENLKKQAAYAKRLKNSGVLRASKACKALTSSIQSKFLHVDIPLTLSDFDNVKSTLCKWEKKACDASPIIKLCCYIAGYSFAIIGWLFSKTIALAYNKLLNKAINIYAKKYLPQTLKTVFDGIFAKSVRSQGYKGAIFALLNTLPEWIKQSPTSQNAATLPSNEELEEAKKLIYTFIEPLQKITEKHDLLVCGYNLIDDLILPNMEKIASLLATTLRALMANRDSVYQMINKALLGIASSIDAWDTPITDPESIRIQGRAEVRKFHEETKPTLLKYAVAQIPSAIKASIPALIKKIPGTMLSTAYNLIGRSPSDSLIDSETSTNISHPAENFIDKTKRHITMGVSVIGEKARAVATITKRYIATGVSAVRTAAPVVANTTAIVSRALYNWDSSELQNAAVNTTDQFIGEKLENLLHSLINMLVNPSTQEALLCRAVNRCSR